MIEMRCPMCQEQLYIPDQYRGQSGKCTKCQSPIVVPMASLTPAQQSAFSTMTAPPMQTPRPSFFSFRHREQTPAEQLVAAQRAHTRALNSNFSCLIIVLLVLFCPIWVPALLIAFGIFAVAVAPPVEHDNYETEQAGSYETVPEVNYVEQPAQEPIKQTYALVAHVVKVAPFSDTGADCDVEVTNTSPTLLKMIKIDMTYTGFAGEYLGTCDFIVFNIPAGATAIKKAIIRDAIPEQLANYTLRVNSVISEDGGFNSEQFTIAESPN